MTPPIHIVMMDDEPIHMNYIIKALVSEGFDVDVIDNADDAWTYFDKPRPNIRAIILDIMMPPAQAFQDEDHDEGLRSGVFIYRHILEQLHEHTVTSTGLPVGILTNVENTLTLTTVDLQRKELWPDHKLRFWEKLGVSPKQFAKEFKAWI